MLLAEFGTGQVFWSMLWFFLFFIWIWLLISLFGDIFRSSDLSGWSKALWCIFIIILPFLGVLVYLIARGNSMQERSMKEAANQEAAFRGYVQQVAGSSGGGGAADEISKLADLRDKGVISEDEFQSAKAKALG
jgi:uncharacterized membrane protein YgcG